jgi:hypothetical protein
MIYLGPVLGFRGGDATIVHPPPNIGEAFFIDHVISGDSPEFEPGISAELLKIPGTSSRLRAQRNWLGLALDETQAPRLWANWWFEHEDTEPATQRDSPGGRQRQRRRLTLVLTRHQCRR